MVGKSKGLGRGFESLIPTDLVEAQFDPTSNEDAKISKLKDLKLEDIVRDESQPRKNFDQGSLEELADSIREHGVVQPIVVTEIGGKYQIVAGERRYRASQIAGEKTIPAIVRTMDDQHRLELMIVENAQREDLNPIELATAYAKLKEQFNLTNEEIGKRVGKKAGSIVNTLRLLKLPEDAKKAMQEHNLSEGLMRPLVSAAPEVVADVLPRVIAEDWTARKVEQYIAGKKEKSSARAIKADEHYKDEVRLSEEYECDVRINGRTVTFSTKNEAELKKLLAKF